MKNLKSTENPTPVANQFSREDSMPAASTPRLTDVDYKELSQLMDKQLAKSSRTYVKELQKQFNRIIRDNQKNYDRLSSDNRRMLKTIEDLQSSQVHLQHQLELHQEREKLAVLREQQDVKRIRDLEDRLSFLLLAPVQNHRITMDDSNRSEIAIEQAEIVETVEEIGDGTASESPPEDIPTVDSLKVVTEEDQPQGPQGDTDEQITAPRSEEEPDGDPPGDNDTTSDTSDLLNGEATAPLYEGLEKPGEELPLQDTEQLSDMVVDVSREGNQAIRLFRAGNEEKEEDAAEPSTGKQATGGSVSDMIVESRLDGKNILAGNLDEEPGGMVNESGKAREETNHESESTPASFSSLNIPGAMPVVGKGLKLVSPQVEKVPAKYESSKNGDQNGSMAEPSTNVIETSGESPPLGIGPTQSVVSGSEDLSVLTEEDSEISADIPLHDPENEPVGQQASSSMNSIAASAVNDVVTTDDDDIIELQEEISIEKPGVEIDDTEAAAEEITADSDLEMPGMQHDSDMAMGTEFAAETEGSGQASDDDADTSSFEIIELQEENIVTAMPSAGEDVLGAELKASVNVSTAENLSSEVADALQSDPVSGDATAAILTSGDARELFSRGKSACVSKDYSQAAVYFDRFVELVPDEPRGHYNLALLYYRLKKYPAARTHAKRARALDYAPSDRILRKIEAKLSGKTKKYHSRERSIEASRTDGPVTLKEIAQSAAGMPFDDETLVYEPDILPNFNLEISKSEPSEDGIDEPYELLSPVEDDPLDPGLPDNRSAGETSGEMIEASSAGNLVPEILEQDIESPRIEKTVELSSQTSVPMGDAVPHDPDAEAGVESLDWRRDGSDAPETPGGALVEEESFSDAMNGESNAEDARGLFNLALVHYRSKQYRRAKKHAEKAWGLGYEPAEQILEKIISKMDSEATGNDSAAQGALKGDMVSGYSPLGEETSLSAVPSDGVESPSEDAAAGLDESTPGGQETFVDKASIDNYTGPRAHLTPLDEQPIIVDSTGIEGQEENRFEPQPAISDLEETPPREIIEMSPPVAGDVLAGHTAEASPGDGVVESSQEAIPASQYFSLAMTASQNKDYSEAVKCFEKYVEQLPDEPKGHYNLAVLHYRLHEYDKASEHANRALQLGGKSSQKIIDKIEKKRSQNNSEDTETTGVDALSMLLNDSLDFPATELENPVRDDETASIWDADELDDDISPSLAAEATANNSFGAKDDVIVFNASVDPLRVDETTKDALQEDKPSLDDLDNNALGHSPPHGSGDFDAKADDVAHPGNNGIHTAGDNGRINNLFTLGQKAIESKEFLKAIKHFTKVTHLAPEDPRGYYYLAVVSCRLKFFETAREHATHAIELGSEPAKKVLEEIAAHQAAT